MKLNKEREQSGQSLCQDLRLRSLFEFNSTSLMTVDALSCAAYPLSPL